MISRLTNRFEACPMLHPEDSKQAAMLIEFVRSLGVTGSIFHILEHIPEQGTDLYTLLSDDQLVISFEIPRGKQPLQAEEIATTPIAEYRHQLGQGKRRIRLDETLKNARAVLAGNCC